MRATMVRYERVRNLGNYENEKVSVEVALEEGETAEQGMKAARAFVNKQVGVHDTDLLRAKKILAQREDESIRNVTWAEEYLASHPEDEIPF